MEKKNTWETYSSKQLKELEKINAQYRDFLDNGKTERECIDTIVNTIEKSGYRELESLIKEGAALKTGDKVYSVWMNKSIAMFQIGRKPMTDGMNILGAHIDSPRLDVKQNPLYEDGGFAYLDTHYYGGVKKYQWVTIPLAIHGVIVKKDGTCVEINIGENEDDPVFFVSDLLIHLAQEQMEKKAAKVIEGEALDIIVGNKPLLIDKKDKKKDEKEAGKEAVKAGVLDILKETYDIHEEDFVSAELEIVPAGKAREAGFDRSMTLAYGQDDRVCAYTSMQAMLDSDVTDRTMHVRRCLAHSCMLSSDVSSAFDPTYASSFDKKNVAYLGGGMVINKFTGARGKSGSNDANAEYLAHLRHIFDKAEVNFQTAELGKVDLGGGGTIAYILALYGMNVIDSGVAVLNMHAPWEATSKADVYEAYRGYKAFVEGASL